MASILCLAMAHFCLPYRMIINLVSALGTPNYEDIYPVWGAAGRLRAVQFQLLGVGGKIDCGNFTVYVIPSLSQYK